MKERRAKVEELSGGRLGYLHIKAMDQPSLRRFEKELRENRHKEALVIDQRFNGGGNIEQELLAILVQKPYQVWQPRGTEPTDRPFRGYFGPKIVLQNWRMRQQRRDVSGRLPGLGPGQAGRHADDGRGYRHGQLQPDRRLDDPHAAASACSSATASARTWKTTACSRTIFVDNTPEDNLAGRDRQLEVARRRIDEAAPQRQAEHPTNRRRLGRKRRAMTGWDKRQ